MLGWSRTFAARVAAIAAAELVWASECAALSVCQHAVGRIHGQGSFSGHANAPRETALWVRVCGENGRRMPTQLVEQVPDALAEGEIQPALIAGGRAEGAKRQHVRGAVVAVPGYLESVYRIEPSAPLQGSTEYRFLVYERHEPDPEVRTAPILSFATRSEAGPLDAELVPLWLGPVSYRSKQKKVSRYQWTERSLRVGRLGRAPPIIVVDFMSSVSPFAAPLFSDLLFPSADGTVFDGFTCGCGRQLHEADDAEKGVEWMRMTALGTDGQRGSVFWAKVENDRLESFSETKLLQRTALQWSVRYGLPALVVLLIAWGVRRRRRLPGREGTSDDAQARASQAPGPRDE